jgi:hypothetical protein
MGINPGQIAFDRLLFHGHCTFSSTSRVCRIAGDFTY